jgi:16S rRNA (guanine527-N7)-methyltransferase
LEEIRQHFPNLSQLQLAQFEQLKGLYEDWNSKINLISRKDMGQFYTRHVLHSLAIAKVIKFEKGSRLLDVGTGGGFPGIPLAIYFPDVEILAVDSIGKKVMVVNEVAADLSLQNIKGIHQRAEEAEGQFDFVVSRAVTRANRFIPWVEKKFNANSKNDKKNGFLFLKGGDLSQEFKETKRKFEIVELNDFFEDEFFETKKVVYVPM